MIKVDIDNILRSEIDDMGQTCSILSVPVAKKCKKLVATDYSVGMLKQAKKKLQKYDNVKLAKASITKIKCKNNCFDKVIAANVIHLLDNPKEALDELMRVCKVNGRVIIPTYVNAQKKETGIVTHILSRIGIDFKR